MNDTTVLVRADACSDHGLIACIDCKIAQDKALAKKGRAEIVWDLTITDTARPAVHVVAAAA